MCKTVKSKILLVVVTLLFALVCHAQPGKDRLQVASEYVENGKKVYEGLDYIFEKISEYASKEHISKEGMDSVRQAAIIEYTESFPQTKEALEGNTLTEAKVQPQVQKLLSEAGSTIKSYNPRKGFESLADQLGKINRKASETLSKDDAVIVYCTTCVGYFSTMYWLTNKTKWDELGKYVKARNNSKE